MTRIIAFTGAQGTGKTTMRNELVKYLKCTGKTVVDNYIGVESSISRDAAKLGFKINLEANFESQYYILSQYIAADLRTRLYARLNNIDYIIVDRSIIDIVPYARICRDINDIEFDLLELLITKHYKMFPVNTLVYCEPLSFITGDKDRSVDVDYQDKIDNLMLIGYNICSAGPKTDGIYLSNATVENRLYDLIKELSLNG